MPSALKSYCVGPQVGKGAFGSVFRAKALQPRKTKITNGQEVAIKMIDKSLLRKHRDLTDRVRNEVEIHTQLKHPNLLELLDFFEDEKNVYIVSELCHMGELYSYMKKTLKRPLTEPETSKIFRQIVSGVSYLHDLHIIHRDLKCSNILLKADMTVKIADFGLAVRLENANQELNTLCGTLNYICPEIASKKPYGKASDLWALGCILFTLLAGYTPFPGAESSLDDVVNANYTIPDYISYFAKDLIKRLLSKNPANRITAKDILNHEFLAREDSEHSILKYYRLQLLSARHGANGSSSKLFKAYASSKRLRPLRQNIKHAKISILEDGTTVADFHDNQGGCTIEISNCGTRFRMIQRVEDKIQSEQQFDLHKLDQSKLDQIIPSGIMKKYVYVSQFVQLVRSKTPKVIKYCNDGKLSLMENDPLPDFEYKSNDGSIRLRVSAYSGKVILFDGKCSSRKEFSLLPSLSPGAMTRLTNDNATSIDEERLLLPLLNRFNADFWDILAVACDENNKFPLYIRNGQIMTAFGEKDIGPYNPTEIRTMTSMKTMAYSVAPAVNNNNNNNSNNNNNNNKNNNNNRTNLKILNSPEILQLLQRSRLVSLEFQKGIGWCHFLEDGFFLTLFLDGSSLYVDAKANIMYFWENHVKGRIPCKYLISKTTLPPLVKEKLRLFSSFIDRNNNDKENIFEK